MDYWHIDSIEALYKGGELMKLQGTIDLKAIKVTGEKALATESYLNGEVANEIYKRFGVYIRVHIFEEDS